VQNSNVIGKIEYLFSIYEHVKKVFIINEIL
jgi:hypothetical protein